ncbi:MAG: hypothetical protein VW362_07295, partial [Candidatus Nanopelagicales bacterium]
FAVQFARKGGHFRAAGCAADASDKVTTMHAAVFLPPSRFGCVLGSVSRVAPAFPIRSSPAVNRTRAC